MTMTIGGIQKCDVIPPSRDERCTVIADQVVPEYRDGKRSYVCGGVVAKRWQAAWDAAYTALGGDPAWHRYQFVLTIGPIAISPGVELKAGDLLIVDRARGFVRLAQSEDTGQRYVLPKNFRIVNGFLEIPRP